MTSSRSGGSEVYVALGDSISIDLYAGGPGRGGASLLARNRDADFPDWRGHDLATTRPELGFALLATDGGTTASLVDGQLPVLESSAVVPRIVTLTAGGNDVLRAYGDTRAALQIVSVVRTRVGRALDRLRALVRPGDPVVVGTVYDPSDGTGRRGESGSRRGRTSSTSWPSSTPRSASRPVSMAPSWRTSTRASSATASRRAIPGRATRAPETERSGIATSSSPTPGAPMRCGLRSGPPCGTTATGADDRVLSVSTPPP
jgi:hypothetical protein